MVSCPSILILKAVKCQMIHTIIEFLLCIMYKSFLRVTTRLILEVAKILVELHCIIFILQYK